VPGGEFPKVIIDPNERVHVEAAKRTGGAPPHLIGAAVEAPRPISLYRFDKRSSDLGVVLR